MTRSINLRPSKVRVKCAVCKRVFEGKVPKGGDGSVLWPRKHYQVMYDPFLKSKHKSDYVCDGSFEEAEIVEED